MKVLQAMLTIQECVMQNNLYQSQDDLAEPVVVSQASVELTVTTQKSFTSKLSQLKRALPAKRGY